MRVLESAQETEFFFSLSMPAPAFKTLSQFEK